MNWLQAIILGIVQGLTEFLPISSSAHLVLVPHLLGWKFPEDEAFVFNILVQDATLIAVIAYYWNDLVGMVRAALTGLVQRRPFADPQARLGWMLVLATLPAGILGLVLKDAVEAAFASPAMTAIFLFVTAALLLMAERLGRRSRDLTVLSAIDALWIGLFQAISIFPGISRSGAAITGGMLRNLERPAAARFAFLMSVPVMLGAGLLATLDLFELPNAAALIPAFIPGFVAAAVVGYLSIRWLIGFVTHRSLAWFAGYCALLGAITLLFR